MYSSVETTRPSASFCYPVKQLSPFSLCNSMQQNLLKSNFITLQISTFSPIKFKKCAVFESDGSEIAYAVLQLATGWTVRGSNPGGGEILRTCPPRL